MDAFLQYVELFGHTPKAKDARAIEEKKHAKREAAAAAKLTRDAPKSVKFVDLEYGGVEIGKDVDVYRAPSV